MSSRSTFTAVDVEVDFFINKLTYYGWSLGRTGGICPASLQKGPSQCGCHNGGRWFGIARGEWVWASIWTLEGRDAFGSVDGSKYERFSIYCNMYNFTSFPLQKICIHLTLMPGLLQRLQICPRLSIFVLVLQLLGLQYQDQAIPW